MLHHGGRGVESIEWLRYEGYLSIETRGGNTNVKGIRLVLLTGIHLRTDTRPGEPERLNLMALNRMFSVNSINRKRGGMDKVSRPKNIM